MFVYALVFCRMPEIKNVSMIKCEKWFHTRCETVDEEVLDKSDVQWICHSCNTYITVYFVAIF